MNLKVLAAARELVERAERDGQAADSRLQTTLIDLAVTLAPICQIGTVTFLPRYL